MKVCHVTSAHPQLDIRIFIKECRTLAREGYDVYLVSQGKSREIDGVHLIGCGDIPAGRYNRFSSFDKKVVEQALAIDADVYHLHDPELLRFVKKFKSKGKIVVFDSHENVPKQIMAKEWIPGILRRPVSKIYKSLETHYLKYVDLVIAISDEHAAHFKGRAVKTVSVANFPDLSDISFADTPFSMRERTVCYAGGINHLRGEDLMIESVKDIDCTLIIAGPHEPKEFRNGSSVVKYVGNLDRSGVNELYASSRVGLVVLLYTPNHYNSLPIKMFEYMAAGLPVVASDFPTWRKIIDENSCGINVNIESPEEVASAVKRLIDDPEYAQNLGVNGRRAVERKYNWSVEAKKLLKAYKELEALIK